MAGDDREVVKTYVPPEQKDRWQEHAAALDMTQSEYLRSMVQAGRRGFLENTEEGGSGDATPRGDGLEDRVLDAVESEGPVSWDELVADLSGDFESRLEAALQSLQDGDEIQHSPRKGGYVPREDQ